MTAPLRIAVLGVGRIGRLHAEILDRQVPGACLASVTDSDPVRAAVIGATLGTLAIDLDAVWAHSGIDAVAICSPTGTHAALILAAAEAGKAIFCEKPIALDLIEVDRALAAVEAAGVPFMVGFNRRFDPAHRAVHDAVAGGRIGEAHLVRITSRDPAPPPPAYVRLSGGIFLDMTIHDFDMARYVTGSDVVEVYAQGARRIEPAYAEVGDVDTAVVNLRHDDGCLTVIDNSRQAVYGYDQRVEVFGSKGMAASENPLAYPSVVRTADGSRQPPLPHFFVERYIPSYIREWQAFVAAVVAGEAPPVTGSDGRAPLVMGLAANRSMAEHRPVSLCEIDGGVRP